MYRPLLDALPTSPAAWWERLGEMVGSWHGVDLGPREVGRTERDRLGELAGVEVSPAVDEWAAFHAALSGGGLFTRAIRDDYALEWREDLRAVTLLVQGEQDFCWGIAERDLGEEDPPVMGWLVDYDTGEWHRGTPWSPTTTNFVLNHVLSYLVGSVAGFTIDVDSIAEADDLLGSLPEIRAFVHGRVVYEGTDLLGCAGIGPWLDEPRVQLKIELGEGSSRDLPVGLRRRLDAGGGLRHGDLTG